MFIINLPIQSHPVQSLKYFPLSQRVLRGVLRNVAGEEEWEDWVEHGGENSHIDFPIMSWNSIFIDCL